MRTLEPFQDPEFFIFLEKQSLTHKIDGFWQIENDFKELLDSCYDDVVIMGYTYTTSDALSSTDPTTYRCALADYVSENYIEISNCLPNDKEGYIHIEAYDSLANDFQEYLQNNLQKTKEKPCEL